MNFRSRLFGRSSSKSTQIGRWQKKINTAVKKNHFNASDRDLSMFWGYCAMADRPDFEGDEMDYHHLTKEAKQYGVDFGDAVSNNKIENAQKIYDKIMSLERVTVDNYAYNVIGGGE